MALHGLRIDISQDLIEKWPQHGHQKGKGLKIYIDLINRVPVEILNSVLPYQNGEMYSIYS